MLYLYIDNYRGFQDTYIPIYDVNFLVGENSTGKTSILSLLNLLSDFQFWYSSCEFNNKDVQLGTFKDLVSKKSSNQDCINIGLMQVEEGEKNISAFLFSFYQKEGIPVLEKMFYYLSDYEVNMFIKGNDVDYRFSSLQSGSNPETWFRGLVNGWKSMKINHEFKKMSITMKREKPIPIAYLFEQVFREHITQFQKRPMPHPLHSMQKIFRDIVWFAPIRSKPRRTYDEFRTDYSPDGAHTPYVIRQILSNDKKQGEFKKFLKEFGKGLLDSVKINPFGSEDVTSPFALEIVLDELTLNINNVGYGISQCLPLLVEIFKRENDTWFAIQEPEIHLHPKAQAALGDLIFYAANEQGKKFLIETHSDFAIDRFRLRTKNEPKKKMNSQVLYFERTAGGNSVQQIKIQDNGDYSDKQPKNFRAFFLKEQASLLSL